MIEYFIIVGVMCAVVHFVEKGITGRELEKRKEKYKGLWK